MERKASLFLLDDMAGSCDASTQGDGKAQRSKPYESRVSSHQNTRSLFLFLFQSHYRNYMGAMLRARSILSSRKSQTHGPNFSGALVEVSIKSSCAYTQKLAQLSIHVGL